MGKNTSYYTKGIRRKLTAFAFEKNLINNQRQVKLIRKLVHDVKYPLQCKFSKKYSALNYLDKTYSDTLKFEEGIAIAHKGGDKNPLTPALYAVYLYNQEDKALFNRHIEYLLRIKKTKNEQCYWEYTSEVVRFNIPPPWVSGISQGLIASAFLRAYHDTNDQEYLNVAKGAIAFCLDENNGLRTEMRVGYWIEEYPSEKGNGVLNGFIFFLIALGELASFGHFENEFNEGIKSLLARIDFYHKGMYIKYGKNIQDLGNPLYDKIHYHQLNALYSLTKETTFLKLKKYWEETSMTNFKT